ncbi:hypothetical protein MNBD_ALPHA08-1102 [hydrothermal vent metagenome]|uniref:Mlr4354 like protein n=1 Tax=hydrothermal vent metagenome TaxID=652676 RepID=A0A3B0S375_9ZZZZ
MISDTMIRFSKTMIVGATFALLMAPVAAIAQPKPDLLGSFKDWAAYTYNNGKSKVCYIVSQPKDSSPKGLNRDAVFFLVTHRPGDKVRNEVNTIIGYPFRKGSTTSVTIDKASAFKFFTSGDGAWAGSKDADGKVVRAMKAGGSMVVVGRSGRGTRTTDRYSLAGVSAAMKKIDEVCQ